MNDEHFLSLIEDNKVVLSKENTSEMKKAKKRAWCDIEHGLKEKDIIMSIEKLKKKWMNMKTRVLEKMRKRQATGGGPPIPLTSVDDRIINLLGKKNPKIARVPRACSSSFLNTSNANILMGNEGDDVDMNIEHDKENDWEELSPLLKTQRKGMFHFLNF